MQREAKKSPAQQKRWDRAEEIFKKQKGHKPKGDDYALVQHIYQGMERTQWTPGKKKARGRASYEMKNLRVRNLSVKEYEASDLGTSYRSGKVRLSADVWVTDNSRSDWVTGLGIFELRDEVIELNEHPHQGTIWMNFDRKGRRDQALEMALADDRVQDQILKALGRVEFVYHENNRMASKAIRLAASKPVGHPLRTALLDALKR